MVNGCLAGGAGYVGIQRAYTEELRTHAFGSARPSFTVIVLLLASTLIDWFLMSGVAGGCVACVRQLKDEVTADGEMVKGPHTPSQSGRSSKASERHDDGRDLELTQTGLLAGATMRSTDKPPSSAEM